MWRAFRREWWQFTPFYFYGLMALLLGGAAIKSWPGSSLKMLLIIVAGCLSWALIEYALHRFVFHYQAESARGREIIYNMHLNHHEDPKNVDQLFAGLRTSLPVATLYCLAAWLATGSWQVMALLFTGLIVGYLSYETLHYQAHHSAPRTRLFQYLKKYHMLHHHQDARLRFGVTTPIFDLLFGTYAPIGAGRSSLPVDKI